MENLISIINELQDAFYSLNDSSFQVDLPQIAVVGSQSAGKSSVLVKFVGRDFLPQGSGIVTRRPLILQLVYSNNNEEFGEFLHLRGQKFTDFEEIKKEIIRETDRLTGTNKGISHIPINLKIHSPNVLDLTLVDLPGLTKVPVGDQPEDIDVQIRDMIRTYIRQPNCLILAITPANTDLATSDALKFAQEEDPEGNRTIGVLTKLDLMDEGTDARKILDNQLFSLRYGFIGLVNRSQKDLDKKLDILQSYEAEMNYFKSHPAYRDIIDRMGTKYLQGYLNKHLTVHIAQSLPDLKLKLRNMKAKIEEQLASFQTEYNYEDPYWKSKQLILSSVNFAEQFRISLLGNSESHLNFQSFSNGHQIMRLFHSVYPEMLYNTEFTKEEVMKREIGYAIQNILGVRTGLFTPDQAFDLVIRTQVSKLEDPTLEFLNLIEEKIIESLRETASKEMSHFPRLQKEIENLAKVQVSKLLETTKDQVQNLLKYERGYINTKHEDFVGFSYAEQKAYSRVLKRRDPGSTITQSGFLFLNRGKKYWFVLSPEALCWYSDSTENERLYMIPIDDGLRFRDHHHYNRFSIFNIADVNVHRDSKKVELQTETLEELETWKKKLIQVGVFSDSAEDTNCILNSGSDQNVSISKEILETNDPWLERQIEMLWILIECYMNIVCRTLKDLVPKCITFVLIKGCVEFLEKKLVSEILFISNPDSLMEENMEEIKRKESLTKTLNACNFAYEKLSVIQIPKIEDLQALNYVPRPAKPLPPVKPKFTESQKKISEPRANNSSSSGRPLIEEKLKRKDSKSESRQSQRKPSNQQPSVNKALKQITSNQQSTFY